MKILFAAAEGLPFIKTGGLGDVIGSLPAALHDKGLDARVILPLYEDIPDPYKTQMQPLKELTVALGWRNQYCGIKTLAHNGVPFYFIDNEYYFKRNGLYGFYDDGERFAFFCRAILAALPHLNFSPDIIHCHDWHTGIIGAFREAFYRDSRDYQALRLVFTIHNLAYQGIFPPQIRGDLLGLGADFPIAKIEHNNLVNFMKTGIVYADAVTTVSPTYAAEIQQPFYGEGLDGLLRANQAKLLGILNGLDYRDFDPLSDRALYCNYRDSIADKIQNKLRLQAELGLESGADRPLLILISRLVKQKGLDLLNHIIAELLAADLQLAVLGSGEEHYQKAFSERAAAHPGRMAVRLGFDDTLARRMYAGGDIFLMPSLFEPCGLGQLIAMRYGSIPVVRETGGLKDTVRPYFEGPAADAGSGNGFTFADYNAHELLFAVKRALEFYRRRESWQQIVRNAMQTDYSWEHSAGEYVGLYRSLIS